MKSLDPDPLQGSFTLQGAKVAVLGYDADARDHALALRRAGNTVMVGVQPDTTCWSRAVADGFAVDHGGVIVAKAEVVVVLVRDHELTWRQAESHVPAGALVIFGCARALETGACTRSGVDVVLVTTVDDAHTGCRIAVHRDVTGRALVRAVGYARAACETGVALRSTSVAAEADLELASIGERAGNLLALAASSERLPAMSRPPLLGDEDDGVPEERTWFDSMLDWRSRR